MSYVLAWITEIVFPLELWILLFPVVWLAVAPVILVSALFQRGGYYASVCSMFSAVARFWAKGAGT